MTTLNKKDRNTAITNILKASFEPRFDELQRLLNEAVSNRVKEHVPKLKEWLADPDLAPHISVHFRFEPYYSSNGSNVYNFKRPSDWAHEAQVYRPSVVPYGWSDVAKNIFVSCKVPVACLPKNFIYFNDLETYHAAIWEDLSASAVKLRQTLSAYKTREKFEVDFPLLAKYLPPRVVTTSTGVIIKPADVMQDLAALGIPPEVEEVAYASPSL